MGQTFFMGWEPLFMHWLQSFENPAITAVWTAFTMLGETTVVVCLFGIIYWGIDKQLGKKVGIAVISALCLSMVLKNIILRRRPYMDHDNVKCIRPAHKDGDIYDVAAQGYSCPSAHSSLSSSLYGTAAASFSHKAVRIIGFAIPVLVALSRLYLGVHYPTDVLGGLVIGFGFMGLTGFIIKRFEKEWVLYAILSGVMLVPMVIVREKELTLLWFTMTAIFAGFVFEKAKVNFENAATLKMRALRIGFGLILFGGSFLLLRTGLYAILGREFLSRSSFGIFCIKGVIYAIPAFLVTGIYPIFIKRFLTEKQEGTFGQDEEQN